ncbi:DUF1561 family protein [Helicobacter zhangjianzhongii]|uniref:DUF1561 domain-containing protein n=1 Tax=Helicobacter zhangjianzhongii TaxID=2974574 RepID=A0ACC6FPV9_9HELI|nr:MULTISPECIES: DUF1561 family protein [unclassified Helicobacter]MDL0079105.1 DUF1561 domain-containing protein [Helicobacter sp. CPD2-1]MDL0081132.1 DUF1561 domain-containing protein [Helicobacter sp. XJK30-2]
MKRYCFLLLLPLLYTLTLHAALESTLAQQVDSRENAPTLSLRGSEATKAIHKESAQVDSSHATTLSKPAKDSRILELESGFFEPRKDNKTRGLLTQRGDEIHDSRPKPATAVQGGAAAGFFRKAESTKQKPTPETKKAHAPKDTPIKVHTSVDTFCYTPKPTSSGIYLQLNLCGNDASQKARYDVFSRLAYKLNGSWFCITAPDSVSKGRAAKDYALLTPCAINSPEQQWILKDMHFYNAKQTYMLKDDGSYIYAAKLRDSSLPRHTLSSDMQSWIDTIAQPGSLSIETFIAWDLPSKFGNERYFLAGNHSSKNTTPIYYNLQNGHIALFNAPNARLDCAYADDNGAQWEWIWWAKCSDETPPKLNKAHWKLIPTKANEVALLNFQNNPLRLTRYGASWGAPYIVTPEYMQSDIGNSAISSFALSNDALEWLRFINANAGENLSTCPAPSYEPSSATAAKARHKRSPKPTPLPSNFRFSSEWRDRFLAIITTTDSSMSAAGICGVCLLQSFQIVAEILENPSSPRRSGGYFFDTQYGTNPFVSFGLRHSLLYESLHDILGWFRLYVRREFVTPEFISLSSNNTAVASAISLLPQYDWNIPILGLNPTQNNQVAEHILRSPGGSVFILLMDLITPDGRRGSHAMVAIRTNDGTRIIPTNILMSQEEFAAYTIPVYTRQDFLARLVEGGYTLERLAALQASAYHTLPFASVVSVGDCSGDGANRRGSGGAFGVEGVNQCESGRCLW